MNVEERKKLSLIKYKQTIVRCTNTTKDIADDILISELNDSYAQAQRCDFRVTQVSVYIFLFDARIRYWELDGKKIQRKESIVQHGGVR